jgi:hypothetical protein
MKKIKIIMLIVIGILAVCCKKSRQSNANITYTNINKTITRSTTNIDYNLDIDKDGLDDMKFRFDLVNAASINSTYYYNLIEVKNDSLSFHCSKLDLNWKGNIIRNSYPLPYTEQSAISSTISSGYWTDNYFLDYPYLYGKAEEIDKSSSSVIKAFSNNYKNYIAIKIKKNGSYYFGWICLSISEDGESTTIYDAAISKLPNTSIKAGEK